MFKDIFKFNLREIGDGLLAVDIKCNATMDAEHFKEPIFREGLASYFEDACKDFAKEMQSE